MMGGFRKRFTIKCWSGYTSIYFYMHIKQLTDHDVPNWINKGLSLIHSFCLFFQTLLRVLGTHAACCVRITSSWTLRVVPCASAVTRVQVSSVPMDTHVLWKRRPARLSLALPCQPVSCEKYAPTSAGLGVYSNFGELISSMLCN